MFERPTRKSSLLCPRGIGLAASALLGFAGMATSASAQCGQYTMSQSTGTVVPGTVDIGNHCDDCGTTIALPFSFSYFGTTYNNVTPTSNGYMLFSATDPQGTYNENTYCIPYAGFTG